MQAIMACSTHITMEVVHLPCMNHISVVRHAGPVVQTGPVGDFLHVALGCLGQVKGNHVYGQFVLGLGLVEVLLVQVGAEDLGGIGGHHKQRIILNTQGSNVVSALLAEAGLVLILHNSDKRRQVCDMQLFVANKIEL